MKIIREEQSGNDKNRVVMALGSVEMEIILGVLKKYKHAIPLGERWKQDGRRVSNMIKELVRGLEL